MTWTAQRDRICRSPSRGRQRQYTLCKLRFAAAGHVDIGVHGVHMDCEHCGACHEFEAACHLQADHRHMLRRPDSRRPIWIEDDLLTHVHMHDVSFSRAALAVKVSSGADAPAGQH